MQKYIYKVINLINQKVYIGQTVNPKSRRADHWRGGSSDEETKYLYRAMNKYGKENFDFQIIEGPIENYNEREKYWIAYYNSYIGFENAWGYNLTPGGDEPPHPKGEAHHYATHTLKEVEEIQELLKTTDMSTEEIAKKYNYNRSSIERINKGIIWNDEEISYPIRPEGTHDFGEERANKIKYDLMHTRLTQKEIGKKYNLGRTAITAINNGRNFFDENLSYPLRKANCQSKVIYCCDKETGTILHEYPSATAAARALNKNSPANITACARGEIKSVYGYIWKYKE